MNILTEKDLDKALKDMWKQPTTPPVEWIRSYDYGSRGGYLSKWNWKYWWIKHKLNKIIREVTKDMPKSSPYPTLTKTTYKDLK